MSERDFTKEAMAEDVLRSAYRQWISSRIETIHRNVTAHDILRRNGVSLRYGSDTDEQFSCPFHGVDRKFSAKVYRETARGPSGVWCFVCQERWDVISLWRKFNDFTGKFTSLLREIELAYGITVPDSPVDHYADYEPPDNYALDEVKMLLDVCERRLKKARPTFDMANFLKVSVALDRIRHQLDERRLPLPNAKTVLTSILDKIGMRVRACPVD